MTDSPIILSCLFTSDDFDIHPAPLQGSSFFFTNRSDIADRAQEQGWTPLLMPLPKENDILALSLQSKAIKFLTFLDEPIYPQVKNHDRGILYFDHKFRVEAHHVSNIVACAQDAAIVIRSTPRPKNSIWTEVEAAMGQERYSRYMTETKRYVERMLGHGVSADVRICNTGLIYYADPQAAKPLAHRVFSSCLLQKQPECQIFWAAHSQQYSSIIKIIEWDDPAVADILWEDPKRVLPKRLRSLPMRLTKELRRAFKKLGFR